MNERVFIPHNECTVTNGDCFTEGKCLRACRSHSKERLEKRVVSLEGMVVVLAGRIASLEAKQSRHDPEVTRMAIDAARADWYHGR